MSGTFTIPVLQTGTYEHYKGSLYRVLGVGRHTEVDEYFVVYEPLVRSEDKPAIWLRPYAMFIESVEIHGRAVPRFKKVQEEK